VLALAFVDEFRWDTMLSYIPKRAFQANFGEQRRSENRWESPPAGSRLGGFGHPQPGICN
jgi:hypothetical protein